MIQIGKYIEIAIQWLTENFAPFFDAVNSGIGGGIDVFNQALLWIPFYLFIILFTVLA
jgi:glycine betaine/proline transport system permease protein